MYLLVSVFWTKYSRMDQVQLVEDGLLKILLSPFLNTSYHLMPVMILPTPNIIHFFIQVYVMVFVRVFMTLCVEVTEKHIIMNVY